MRKPLERPRRRRARRDVGVELVRQVEVDVVDAEALEARVQLARRCAPGARPWSAAGRPSGCRSWWSAAAAGRASAIQLPIDRLRCARRRRRRRCRSGVMPELPGGVHDRERLRLVEPLAEELGRGADAAEVAAAEAMRGGHLGAPEASLDPGRVVTEARSFIGTASASSRSCRGERAAIR